MGLETAALIISATAAVGSAVQGVMQAKEAKKNAKRQARIQEEQRTLQMKRDKAALARATRLKQAAVLNNSAQSGAQFSSSASQGITAIGTKQAGELDYLQQGLDLAKQSDAITLAQINSDASSAMWGNITSGIGNLTNTMTTDYSAAAKNFKANAAGITDIFNG